MDQEQQPAAGADAGPEIHVLTLTVETIEAKQRDAALNAIQRQMLPLRFSLGLASEGAPYLKPQCPKCFATVEYAKAADVPLEDVPCPAGCAKVLLVHYEVKSRILTPAQVTQMKIRHAAAVRRLNGSRR